MLLTTGLALAQEAPAAVPVDELSPAASVEDIDSIEEEVEVQAAPAKTRTALITLKGQYLDLPEAGFGVQDLLMGGGPTKPQPFFDLQEKIAGIANSKDTEMVVLDLTKSFGLNGVQIGELDRAFATVRDSGKQTIAYLRGGSAAHYQLACMCDGIYLADMGALDLKAPGMSIMFMRDVMDLLGVRMEVVKVGDFKGAVEPYLLSSMSDHLRDHYKDMLRSVNKEWVGRIADRRGLDERDVRKLQGERLISAKDAVEAGLVDQLVPWRDVKRVVSDLAESELDFFNPLGKEEESGGSPMEFFSALFNSKKDKDEGVEFESIVVLHLSGAIVDGDSGQPGSIVSGKSVKEIKRLMKDDNVEGVVLRINSPGGSATASEEILLALKELAEVKPVVCSMGSVAASGGYYVTCFGQPIYAEEGTITGSIGVFGMVPNAGPLFRRVGIHMEHVVLDESAIAGSIDRPWDEKMKAKMQDSVDEIYERFLGHVAASRKMTREQLKGLCGGRVWSGKQALEAGLIDHLGGLDDAIAAVAKAAELEGDDYDILHRPNAGNALDGLFGNLMSVKANNALQGIDFNSSVARTLLEFAGDLSGHLTVLQESLKPGGAFKVWALQPGSYDIR